MAQQISDPGFGTRVGRTSGRIVNADGSLNVRRVGDRFHITDVYHFLLTARWWKFVLLVFGVYMAVNLVFASVYIAIGTDQLTMMPDHTASQSFEAALLFSAQTLTTVGYGTLAPRTTFIGAVAAFEALTGLLLFGIFTGVTFGRFARIQPRITFSDEAVIGPLRDEMNAFMFRLVNERSSVVMDASATCLLVLAEPLKNQSARRYFQLPLEAPRITSLALNWTLVHPITTESPLFGLSDKELRDAKAEFLITIQAFDDTVGQSFYARMSYTADQIVRGRRFEPMFWTNEHGDVELHINKVHNHVEAELLPEVRV